MSHVLMRSHVLSTTESQRVEVRESPTPSQCRFGSFGDRFVSDVPPRASVDSRAGSAARAPPDARGLLAWPLAGSGAVSTAYRDTTSLLLT